MKAKKLSKRVVSSALSLMMAVGCFAIPSTYVDAADDITINFHYLRDDQSYDDWAMWIWPGKGEDYIFDGEVDENGAQLSFTLDEAATEVGFIIKSKGTWNQKDPEPDRYVDVSAVVSGTIDVYCKTGIEEFETDYSKALMGLKVKSAAADSHTEISFEFTSAPSEDDEIKDSDFVVTNALGEQVGIESVSTTGNSGVIKLSEELDYKKEYVVSFRSSELSVSMPDYFTSEEFVSQYTYNGDDLGATYTAEKTTFRVWAPTANKIELNIYDNGDSGEAENVVEMASDVKGTWLTEVNGDLNGKYYTYTAYFDGKTNKDIVDPYARTVGVNGKRGEIVDLDSTDPEGWSNDSRHTYENVTDMSIYELHIRDFSSDPDSGIKNVGKYIAFAEAGTKTSDGIATGIDHLKDLGVTTVHILPSYDYGSVDETQLDKEQYNFGYDPVNYNSPEGSYSTDPYHGEVRINEYKQMVKALHDAGIGVVMDVVYNHTYNTNYCFEKLVPGYFYRPDGSNGSGCGNDVASERPMVSKFITDSVKYWADEYHLDGFRFDLMGLIDVDTMNDVRAAVDTVDKNIFIYGEGWTLTTNLTRDVALATQTNSALTPGVAYFSDTIRDAIRGNVFEDTEKGFVGGGTTAAKVKDGVSYSSSWSVSPEQTVNYDSCHDNHTIWDRIANTNPENTEAERISMNKLSAAIIFTSQGVPFIMSGEEFLRTKTKADGTFDHNSYSSPDSVNLLDYSRVGEYSEVYEYYKGLINLRNAFSELRMTTAEQVDSNLSFVSGLGKGVVGYTIKGNLGVNAGSNEKAHDIFVVYNPLAESINVTLPEGNWSVLANGEKAGTEVLATANGTVDISAISAMVLVKDFDSSEIVDDNKQNVDPVNPDDNKKDDDNKGSNNGDNSSDNNKETSDNSNTQNDNKESSDSKGNVDTNNTSNTSNTTNSTNNSTSNNTNNISNNTNAGTGTNNNVSNDSSNTVNTGDNSAMAVMLAALAAGAAFAGFVVYKKKKVHA